MDSGGPVSLYKQCLSLIETLHSIPEFDLYLFPNGYAALQANPASIDPIQVLWTCFRLGTPLCHLYNQLRIGKPLDVPDLGTGAGSDSAPANVNDCKKVGHWEG